MDCKCETNGMNQRKQNRFNQDGLYDYLQSKFVGWMRVGLHHIVSRNGKDQFLFTGKVCNVLHPTKGNNIKCHAEKKKLMSTICNLSVHTHPKEIEFTDRSTRSTNSKRHRKHRIAKELNKKPAKQTR